MKILLSPAKRLDFESDLFINAYSQPRFLENSLEIVDEARKLSAMDLQGMMKISDELATLNQRRFQDFSTPFTPTNARQAVYAFRGDAYYGLDAPSLSDDDMAFAQDHLRILSGLYGLLRPLDLIQPYRLEMGTKFKNQRGANLYAFWGDEITDALNEELADDKDPVVINLASNEYFKAIKPKSLKGRIITPQFKEVKDAVPKVMSVFAKRARGMMTRYIIQNKLEDVDDLRDFNEAGYTFAPELSDADSWVFTRPFVKKGS